MSYQNVSTPKFYISYGDWWRSTGIAVPRYQTISPTETTPVTINEYIPETSNPGNWYSFPPSSTPVPSSYPAGINWVGVLNHNLSVEYKFIHKQYHTSGAVAAYDFEGINYTPGEVNYSGFSIGTTTSNAWTDMGFGNVSIQTGVGTVDEQPVDSDITFNIGCWIYGRTYSMPHSPDLSLTLTREYGGIKTIETKGGASLSNAFYTSPPKWGTREAWQLGDEDFSVGGRRMWSLSFSYLQGSDMFPDNPTEIAGAGGWEDLTTTPDFMSEVLKKTRGSQLPFIFQPDSSNNNPDQFAICKFDMKEFKFEQVANGVYNVKLKIREVW